MRLLLGNLGRVAFAAAIAAFAIQPFSATIAAAASDASPEAGAAAPPAGASGPANTPSGTAPAKQARVSDPAPIGKSLRALLRPELFNSGTDPSNPVNQFSIRNYYFRYRNGEFRDNTILRVVEKAYAGLGLEEELTLATAYRNGRSYYGTGNSYFEALFTPWKTSGLGITLGAGMVIPTGSSSVLGSGKWQLAPIVAPLFYPFGDERLLTYLQLRDFVSVANVGRFNFVSAACDAPFQESPGAQINYLEMKPVVCCTFSDRWYLYAEPIFTALDWERRGEPAYRSALRLGHIFNARIGA